MIKDYSRYYDYITNADDETLNKHLRAINAKLNKRSNAGLSEVEHAIIEYFDMRVEKNKYTSGAFLSYRGQYIDSSVHFKPKANWVDYMRKCDTRRGGVVAEYFKIARCLHAYNPSDATSIKAFYEDNDRYIDKERAVENYKLNAKYREVQKIIKQREHFKKQIDDIYKRCEEEVNNTKHNICVCNADLSKLIGRVKL